jgi:hypothetical protein
MNHTHAALSGVRRAARILRVVVIACAVIIAVCTWILVWVLA